MKIAFTLQTYEFTRIDEYTSWPADDDADSTRNKHLDPSYSHKYFSAVLVYTIAILKSLYQTHHAWLKCSSK